MRVVTTAGATLATESGLSALLADCLPIAVPRYRRVWRLRDGRELGMYDKLPGEPGLTRFIDDLELGELGRRLGTFLRALHDIHPAVAARLGVEPEPGSALGAWTAQALGDLAVCADHGYLEPEQATDWACWLLEDPSVACTGGGDAQVGAADVQGERRGTDAVQTSAGDQGGERWAWRGGAARDRVADPRRVAGEGRLLHGDLAAEHILLDELGLPSGVIDWSDAVLGDVALDLGGLVHWGGARLLDAALATYGAIDGATRDRATRFAACRAFGDLAYGHRHRRPAYLSAGRTALRWALELRQ